MLTQDALGSSAVGESEAAVTLDIDGRAVDRVVCAQCRVARHRQLGTVDHYNSGPDLLNILRFKIGWRRGVVVSGVRHERS